MFTGLIETVGEIVTVNHSATGSMIEVLAPDILEGCRLGDSIAIDGACTTVIAVDSSRFSIEASRETLSKTIMGQYQPGWRVNCERPLMPTSRIGGHYVTGHVDGLARLVSLKEDGLAWSLIFMLESEALAQYIVEKGSIAISGISLTVNWVEQERFGVAIIPHTMTHTNLASLSVGQLVNIETDLLGKYVNKLVAPVLTQVGLHARIQEFEA
jgi:riboflavin synthase